MTADAPTARSPLGHLADDLDRCGSPASVSLREVSFLTQVDLRLPTDRGPVVALDEALGVQLPEQPCTAEFRGSRAALWLGPRWWLVVDEPGRAIDIEAAARTAVQGARGSVADVSAQRAVLDLAGPRARAVLRHGCAIDVHPGALAPGRCVQTTLAKAQVVLYPVDERPGFRIHVAASFADYLARWLLDAMTEYVVTA